MAIINIGIPARVDADKARLTGRLFYAARVIDTSSSNDPIDTRGHPAFIVEVERVLRLLDGAVLVTPTVEGRQPQTRVFMRVPQRSRPPNRILVNKDPLNREEYLLRVARRV